jgi:hypothetical protein
MIRIRLSSANMGNVDGIDFDLWAAYVNAHIDDIAGEPVTVEQGRFGDPGIDEVTGATEDQQEAIERWLARDGWDAFCGDAWTDARAANDAGERDGRAEVDDVLATQGRDVVAATLRAGHVAWDDGARNARAAHLTGIGDAHEEVYYRAYERAARARAQAIADAPEAEAA